MLELFTSLAPDLLKSVTGSAAAKKAKKQAQKANLMNLAKQTLMKPAVTTSRAMPIKRNLPPPPQKGGYGKEVEPPPKEDKTLLYVGIGAAVLAVGGIVLIATKD